MYDTNTFAASCKRVITQRGFTQRQVAEKLGVTETTISRYVTPAPKGRVPTLESLVDLAQVLDVSLDTLVGVEPPAAARQAPDVKILISVYEKAAPEQRDAIWSVLNGFRLLTPEQKAVVDAISAEEKVEAI